MFNGAVLRVRDFVGYDFANQIARSLRRNALPSTKRENRSNRNTADEDDYTETKPPPTALPAHMVVHYS